MRQDLRETLHAVSSKEPQPEYHPRHEDARFYRAVIHIG